MREEGDQKLEWRLNDNDRQQMLMEKKKKTGMKGGQEKLI